MVPFYDNTLNPHSATINGREFLVENTLFTPNLPTAYYNYEEGKNNYEAKQLSVNIRMRVYDLTSVTTIKLNPKLRLLGR